MRTVKPLFCLACSLLVAVVWLGVCLDGQARAGTATTTLTVGVTDEIVAANTPIPLVKQSEILNPAKPSSVQTKDNTVAADKNVEKVTERYPNGHVKIERHVTKDAAGNYVNHGIYTRYNRDGKVQKTGAYVNGKQQGLWTQTFDKDDGHLFTTNGGNDFRGPFVSQATFNNGQLDGVWTIKDGNGQNIVAWTFTDGVRDGCWTWWHPNGKKRLEATYRGGRLDGVQREWNRDSRPIAKNIFVDGRQLVTATGWYTLGQKHYEGYYLRVVKMPEATYDWWNGTVAMSSNMHGDQDLQHGTWIEWYQNGNKKTEAHYDRGMEMGRFIWWYENGQKQAEVDYEGGRPNGVWITWHPNGQKESQAEFHQGRLVGDWMHWDADGKLIEVRDSQGNIRQPNTTDNRVHRSANRQPTVQMMPVR